MQKTILNEIVSRIVARRNCLKSGSDDWYRKHGAELNRLASMLPSGSGLDSGTKIDEESSGEYKLVLNTAYHHMNDGGFYDGWTEHKITIKPNLLHGFELAISGRDRNSIKEYLNDVYLTVLTGEYKP